MIARSLGIVLLALWFLPSQAAAQPLAKKVAEFCEEHVGKKVDNGQCSALVWAALRASGGKELNDFRDHPGKGDYVWGELVYTLVGKKGDPVEKQGEVRKIKPGFVVQYRDTKFTGKDNGESYTYTYGHHTAVVARVRPKTHEIEVFEQNVNGKQIVRKTTLKLTDLHEGWIRVYRPERK
jgi:hypothetical protein